MNFENLNFTRTIFFVERIHERTYRLVLHRVEDAVPVIPTAGFRMPKVPGTAHPETRQDSWWQEERT